MRTRERVDGALKDVIYPYLVALRALIDIGVEHAEKNMVELRTEEVGRLFPDFLGIFMPTTLVGLCSGM